MHGPSGLPAHNAYISVSVINMDSLISTLVDSERNVYTVLALAFALKCLLLHEKMSFPLFNCARTTPKINHSDHRWVIHTSFFFLLSAT